MRAFLRRCAGLALAGLVLAALLYGPAALASDLGGTVHLSGVIAATVDFGPHDCSSSPLAPSSGTAVGWTTKILLGQGRSVLINAVTTKTNKGIDSGIVLDYPYHHQPAHWVYEWYAMPPGSQLTIGSKGARGILSAVVTDADDASAPKLDIKVTWKGCSQA